jgi:hypothetical protein
MHGVCVCVLIAYVGVMLLERYTPTADTNGTKLISLS